MRAELLAVALGLLISSTAAASPQVTFDKDVLKILQTRCQGCHHKGDIGPRAKMLGDCSGASWFTR